MSDEHPNGHDDHQGDGHSDGHGHDHAPALEDTALRTKALESLLTEKGLVDPAALDELIDTKVPPIAPVQ